MDQELANYCDQLNRRRAEELEAEWAELHMLSLDELEIWARIAQEDSQ